VHLGISRKAASSCSLRLPSDEAPINLLVSTWFLVKVSTAFCESSTMMLSISAAPRVSPTPAQGVRRTSRYVSAAAWHAGKALRHWRNKVPAVCSVIFLLRAGLSKRTGAVGVEEDRATPLHHQVILGNWRNLHVVRFGAFWSQRQHLSMACDYMRHTLVLMRSFTIEICCTRRALGLNGGDIGVAEFSSLSV